MNRVFVLACVVAGLSALRYGDNAVAGAKALDPAKGATLGGKILLAPEDFTFVGSYLFSADNQAAYAMGLTSRRVNGKLRFLTFSYSGAVKARLIEFALPEEVGQKVTALTGSWDDVWSPAPRPNIGGGDAYGLWWEQQEEEQGRLWTTHSTDYPNDTGINNTQALAVRSLNADGTVGNLQGEYGFAGVGQRAIYGGVQAIPKWFRGKYGITHPYAVGWGGYTSRVAQGLAPSLGLMALAIPDVSTYKPGSVIAAKDFKILADHRSGTTHASDWYGSGKPSSFDRGQRNADVVNYYDGGDKRSNPQSAPSDPPARGAQWQSPAPDKFGRFVWGDSFYNTGCWIDGPKKGGFLVVGSFSRGKAYYGGSTLHNDGRHAELQIFDPNDFGKVLQGKLAPWKVQPAASKLLTPDLTPLGLLYANSGHNYPGGVGGATFDAISGMLYLWCPLVNGKAANGCCLVAYRVKC